MAKKRRRKLWSVARIKDPRYPQYRLRISEMAPGGNLYAVRMVDGKQVSATLGVTREELGATATEQEDAARALAFEIIARLANGGDLSTNGSSGSNGVEPGEVVTLADLADLYAQHGLHGRSEAYAKEQPEKIRRIAEFLGEDRDVRSLCPSDVEAYTAHRLANDGVRQGTVAGDIDALKIALNWAKRQKRSNGEKLIEANPLADYRVKRDKPRRPVGDEARYRALRAVADQLPSRFGLALDLHFSTGERNTAIRHLRWQDIISDPQEAARLATELDPDSLRWKPKHMPLGGIRWYAGKRSDNKKADRVAPMNRLAHDALKAARPDIVNPEAWIFPRATDPSKPLRYEVMSDWMQRAEKLAKVPHLKGTCWHWLRRLWATLRKHYPQQDVARAGGWRDTVTLARCYTRADADTILDVVNGE